MPFVSQAQRRLFYARPELHKYIAEFDAATPRGAALPEHKPKPGETRMASNFDKLASKLASRPGVTNPRGLAAVIGRRKYGASTMARAAAKGEPARLAARQK